MDSLTQAALGASVGEAAFGRRLGRPAMLFGGFCGLLPDLDVLLGTDPWRSLVVHRAESHSLLVLPLLAILLGWIAWRLSKRRDGLWVWMLLALLSLVTHPLLDWFTSYGTQLLAPLSHRRFALDGVSIIDPVYSLPLFWVTWRAARQRVDAKRRVRSARLVCALTTAYLLIGFGLSQWAAARAEVQLRGAGFEPVSLRAPNTFFNPLAHRVVAVDAEGHAVVGITSALAPVSPIVFARFAWPDSHPALEAALSSENGQIFRWFSGGLLRAEIHPRADGGHRIRLVDIKYGSVERLDLPIFGADFFVDEHVRVTRSELLNRPSLDVGRELKALGARIVGSQPEPPDRAERLMGVP